MTMSEGTFRSVPESGVPGDTEPVKYRLLVNDADGQRSFEVESDAAPAVGDQIRIEVAADEWVTFYVAARSFRLPREGQTTIYLETDQLDEDEETPRSRLRTR
jgi:hypothetical protein